MMQTFDVNLLDDVPTVGSGHRRVLVRSIGHKWVWLKSASAPWDHFARIRRSAWNAIPRCEVYDPAVNNLLTLGDER